MRINGVPFPSWGIEEKSAVTGEREEGEGVRFPEIRSYGYPVQVAISPVRSSLE